jgi:hypothetical protein
MLLAAQGSYCRASGEVMTQPNEDPFTHDMMNALTIIIAHCEMLQINPHNQAEKRIAIIFRTAQTMARMIAEHRNALPTAS